MDKPVPLFVPLCSTNVPSNVPAMEQEETQNCQGIEASFKTFVPFVPRFYTPLLVLCVFYRGFSSVCGFIRFQQWGSE